MVFLNSDSKTEKINVLVKKTAENSKSQSLTVKVSKTSIGGGVINTENAKAEKGGNDGL